MPRILPRLIKLPLSGLYASPSRPVPPRSLRKPVLPLPSVLAADYPRSVLLSPANIITNSHDYVHHKSMPPVHRLRRRRVSYDRPELNQYDATRAMSAQERIWWSSPYLRMLASPIRKCSLTERYLPADFMIRLTPMQVPRAFQQPKFPLMLLPDLQIKRRKAGRGVYFVCRRESLAILLARGKYKRHGASMHARLPEQIAHLLRLRVLQELQLIAKQLEMLYRTRTGPASSRPPVVNRLTRAEWDTLRTTGVLPHSGALAVLVVPPVNRDPITRQRPPAVGAMGGAPLVDASQPHIPPSPKRPSPPLCVLHRTSAPPAPISSISEISISQSDYWEKKRRERASSLTTSPGGFLMPLSKTACDADKSAMPQAHVDPHAEARVPLYNGVPMFPGRVQRAKLHALLLRILGLEGAWRFSAGTRSRRVSAVAAAGKGDNKGSHAFLIHASDEVDIARLGVALWRVRMWEGGGWKERSAVGDIIRKEGDQKDWPWPWVQNVE
ncbi:hypothetical protein B0H15DRAFT_828654 [Mycena belliarum]|uniref:Uncharacterized protein n=1 Tax=Mycena belliarum TaxID=1033014 RepID=A0AAD6XQ59_9AGAR|nr:hypothetical protein B0H15DRAFT_828654 [Mycena belliae]